MEKPFAPSCERNQQVILDELKKIITQKHKNLLEIGTGTGQHAVYMAPHFPDLIWHTSDIKNNHAGIKMWLDEASITNIMYPIEFESGQTPFPELDCDLVFTVNTLHIMSWRHVQTLVELMGAHLKTGTEVIIYGPFNYNGQFTSPSNEEFDQWLKEKNPESAIRDYETLSKLMVNAGFMPISDIEMPANNRLLHFEKKTNHS